MRTIKDKLIPEEIEHMIREFVTKNLSSDAAMMFITIYDITFDDFNDYIWSIKWKPFFFHMFSYLQHWCIDKINQQKFDDIIPLLLKFDISEYRCSDSPNTVDLVFYCRNVIDGIFTRLEQDQTTYRFQILCELLHKENEIYLRDLLLVHWKTLRIDQLAVIVGNEYLNPHEFIQVILQQYRDKKELEYIHKVFEETLPDDCMRIPILDNIFKRYSFLVYGDEKNIDVKQQIIYTDPRLHRGIEMIRSYLTAKLVEDAELDIYNFLERSKLTHEVHRDFLRSSLYDRIQRYLFDGTHREERMARMLEFGYEEDEQLVFGQEENYLSSDVLLAEYIYETREFDAYQKLVRIFNINRFRFLFNDMIDHINEYFGDPDDPEEYAVISLGSNFNFWIFCYIFNNKTKC